MFVNLSFLCLMVVQGLGFQNLEVKFAVADADKLLCLKLQRDIPSRAIDTCTP